MAETIALFGATGSTGKHVLKYALEKGYKVKALVRTPSKVETKHENLTIIEGSLEDSDKVKETVKGSDYVISVAGGPRDPKKYPASMMTEFVKNLWPILDEEASVKAFLYQSGAFAPKPDGSNPFMLKIMRPIAGRMIGIKPLIDDNEAAMKFMDANPKESFKVIVTRPGRLVEKEGGVKLEASDTATMEAITFQDLGAFTVEAIKDESLCNKYPFIVPTQEKK